MRKYGKVSIMACEAMQSGKSSNPVDAWSKATKIVFPNSISSQNKGCPKGAFLGLCEEGKVKGIPEGSYTRSVKNKDYALIALSLLESDPTLTSDQKALWNKVMEGADKQHNQQMDVVISLFEAGHTI